MLLEAARWKTKCTWLQYDTEMIEKGLVYFLKTGVKLPYFVLLVGRLTLKNVTAVAEGVWKTALLK